MKLILALSLGVLCLARSALAQDIRISEIMYHPSSERTDQEYIELYNAEPVAVDLLGWHFSKGVDFTFTNRVLIPSHGYFVVAANLAAFTAKYPSVANVVGNWQGTLSNQGEQIELENQLGENIDQVNYTEQGDWSVRRRGPILAGTRGWEWFAAHDGLGPSLERRSLTLPTDQGQNWGSSTITNGTPGRVNSIQSFDIAPMIVDVGHIPAVPRSMDSIIIHGRIIDEVPTHIAVTLHWRSATEPAPLFLVVPMFDDGMHNDGAANDGVYATVLSPQLNRTVIEYYIEASDGDNARAWPQSALDEIGTPTQTANAVFQVDDTAYTGTQPLFRVIMTETERRILENIGRQSDAQMNATLITTEGSGTEVRYSVGVRIRGAGSRGAAVPNYRVNIPRDRRWHDVSEINLNAQYGHAQVVGAAIALNAGLVAADARPIQVRVNGVNLASAGAVNGYGSYALLEPVGTELIEHHLPNDANGNLYRASTGNHTADLSYRGTNSGSYVGAGYTKNSNTSENDWSDLIHLTDVLQNSADNVYVMNVTNVTDVRRWMRYFALLTLMGYGETSLGTGSGDDYALYRGELDQRFIIIPHDFDTILNQGDTSVPISRDIFTAAQLPIVNRLMRFPDFVGIYYDELETIANDAFAADKIDPVIDRLLRSYVPPGTIAAMKQYAADRRNFVLNQFPRALSIISGLPISNGFRRSTAATTSLNGQAHAGRTRSVRVNGVLANWNAVAGAWNIANVALTPGLNRVIVQSFDDNGEALETGSIEIWYDDSSVAPVTGTLSADTTWTAAGGPYQVTSILTVPSGRTLTIEAGTTVYFAQGARLDVSGRLVAEGTETRRIRFTRQPGTANTWAGFRFTNSNQDNRITFADIDFASTGTAITVDNSTVLVDAVIFSNTTRTLIELVNSSARISRSVFPTLNAQELIHGGPIPANGYVIIEGNVFGSTTGLNDIIDFTGAQRPGPVLQILNNIFTGASDDVLDLDGTDTHIEGNLFMHVHNGNFSAPDTSSAISFGQDSGYAPHVVAVRNLFYDVDHVALAKEGGFITLVNNTALGVGVAVVNFSEPDRGTVPGAGAFLDGNVFWNPPQYTGSNFQNRFPANGTVNLVVHRSIFPATDGLTNGLDNFRIDPRLGNTVTNTITLQNIVQSLSLLPGSPAIGTGPNGLDRGAVVPAGPSLSGVPESPTAKTNLTITVGGPGIVRYSFQLNGGAFSSEVDVNQPLVLSNMTAGAYALTVRGRNSAGVVMSNNLAQASWQVNPGLMRLRINEVLARNTSVFEHVDTFPDLVEIYNDGGATVDLGGMGLSDDLKDPFQFTFPNGTMLAPGNYLVLYGDNEPTPGLHLGFGLEANGDALFLFNSQSRGGALLDSVQFGSQLRDISIGRVTGGEWALTTPTFGQANIPYPVGRPTELKINEWLTDAQTAFEADFLELYNPEPVPVHLGGLFLTDNPLGFPDRHRIADLTFIPAFGHFVFTADGNADAGAEHLNFHLAPEEGTLALYTSDLQEIDTISYFSQSSDVSEGRRPSGSDTFSLFGPPTMTAPTPGGPNPGPAGIVTVTNIVVPVLSLTNQWRYERNGLDLGTSWRNPNFNDSGWPMGSALLGVEGSALPAPGLNTSFPGYDQNQITYYFRTRFNLQTNLTGFMVQASAIIDDGAVVYVNGNEVLRIRMAAGPITFLTQALGPSVNNATLEVYTIPGDSFVQGENVIAVEVHQAQIPSSDIVMGLGFQGSRLETNNTAVAIVINEVLANNRSVLLPGSTNITDWVELYNPGGETVDLSNQSLSDDLSDPRRFVFPEGTSIPSGGYLVVRFDSDNPASTNAQAILNTGFGLNAEGDRVDLYSSPDQGGAALDSISFGFQVPDFSIGRLPTGGSVWDLNLPTPASFNLAASQGDPATLRLNEWLANPSGNDEDFVELFNPNPQPVDLAGLFLTDDLNNRTQHKIAPLSFIGTGEDAFVAFVADGNTRNGPNHLPFGLSRNGDMLGLFNRDSSQIDALTFGSQANGVSEGRFPDGAAEIVKFPGTTTRGTSNIRPLDSIVINEILSHTDDPPREDAIELLNPTVGSVDLSGWWLSDTRSDPKRFRIPDGTVLPPGGHIVFYEYQFNRDFSGLKPYFALSSLGDDVVLSTADRAGHLTGFRARAQFDASKNGVSLGRYQTSIGFDFVALRATTFGMDAAADVETFRQGRGASNALPVIGPVVINEINYHPPDVAGEEDTLDEFIELLNISGGPVNLFDPNFQTNRWELRDAVDFRFPMGVTLNAGEFVLVVGFDPNTNATLTANFRSTNHVPAGVRIFGPYQGMLSDGGESVELYQPDPPVPLGQNNAGEVPFILVDRVNYSDTFPWPQAADSFPADVGGSLQRRRSGDYGNDPVNWLVGHPTGGTATGTAADTLPVVVTQPLSQTVAQGAQVRFDVVATDALVYQWRRNGVDLPNATNSFLLINSAQLIHAGVYSVRAQNFYGTDLSASATLVVQAIPVITQQPASITVVEGAATALTVTAMGTSPLRHQWLREGVAITGQTNAALLFPVVGPTDEGNYRVVVSNTSGSVTSQVAVLSISTPPRIALQPQGTNVFLGSNVVFTVSAVGSPTLRYQWRRNNTVLQGQTSPTLTLNNVQLADAGDYTVQVANDVGTATSDPATLVVMIPPTVSIVAADAIASEPGADTGMFVIVRQGSTNSALTVPILVAGTALAGSDYQTLASPVTIPAGVTNVSLLVTVLDDGLAEGDETVMVTLQLAQGYRLGNTVSAIVTIKDEDNRPPTVALTNPPPASVFGVGQNILLGATATDNDGSVARVEFFYNGGNKIGQATAPPYLLTWSNAPSGNLTLTAVATDNLGSTTVSAPVAIQVNAAPTVAITAPASGAQFNSPANITITAFAEDLDGSIARVEFFQGGASLGVVSNGISPLRADYQFANNLTSAVAGAPDLVDLGANNFQDDSVDGQNRRVFRFQANTGLSLSGASSLFPSNLYTIALLFRFDQITSWRRILDFKNGTVDDGIYSLDGALQFYPSIGGAAPSIAANTYVQVVLTRDSGRNAVGYVNGVQQFTLVDTLNQGALDGANVLRIFRDDGTEASAGSVARLRIFNTALNAAQVAALDRLPSAVSTGGSYSLTWSNVMAGNYVLTARATDNLGANSTSAPVSISVQAPNANLADMFADRAFLSGFIYSITANNSSYTHEAGEPRHDNRNGAHSGWLAWTAPESGMVTMDTLGSGFDTVLAVYQGDNVSALTRIASNDDAGALLQSQLSFVAEANAVYQIAIDGYGSRDSGNVVFHLSLERAAPLIVTQPLGSIVNRGSPVSFSVTATGAAPLTYQWRFEGTDIPGAVQAQLNLNNVQTTNSGSYTVVVRNNAGSVESNPATLVVRAPPSIITQPQPVILNRDGQASFRVVADGTPPLRYQWRKTGVVLAGQTNSILMLNNVQYADGGAYQVIVSNASGSQGTQPADLVILARLLTPQKMQDGSVVLMLEGMPGRSYVLQHSTNTFNWDDLGTAVESGNVFQLIDSGAPGHSWQVYRARLVSP